MKILASTILMGAIIATSFATPAVAASKQNKQFSESELKLMDTNQDNMVSKDEFLSYNELAFNKMKLTNGMLVLKGKSKTNNTVKPSDDESSMNNKPIGTTTENPSVNERDAVNGKSY